MSRGQTTIDFAVGVGIFLLSVAFVVAFVPGMLEPFETSLQEETVAADRAATQVSSDMLAADEQAYLLDRECTVAFFDASAPDATCAFDGDDGLNERLGFDSRIHLNISLVGDDTDGDGAPEALCEGPEGQLVEETAASCDPFEVGEPVPDQTNSVVVARRSVSVEGVRGMLLVRVW